VVVRKFGQEILPRALTQLVLQAGAAWTVTRSGSLAERANAIDESDAMPSRQSARVSNLRSDRPPAWGDPHCGRRMLEEHSCVVAYMTPTSIVRHWHMLGVVAFARRVWPSADPAGMVDRPPRLRGAPKVRLRTVATDAVFATDESDRQRSVAGSAGPRQTEVFRNHYPDGDKQYDDCNGHQGPEAEKPFKFSNGRVWHHALPPSAAVPWAINYSARSA